MEKGVDDQERPEGQAPGRGDQPPTGPFEGSDKLQRTEQKQRAEDQPHHSEHRVRDIGLSQGDTSERVQAPIFTRGDDLVIRLDQRGRYSNPAFRACIATIQQRVAGS